MTQRGRLGLSVTVYLGMLLVLSACGAKSPEAGQPITAPGAPNAQSSKSSQATTRPNLLPPARPDSAQGLTLASAELFIRHYVDLMNYAAKTGDTSAMRDASDPRCVNCGRYYKSVEMVNEQNGGLSGDYQEKVVEVLELARTEQQRLAASTSVTVGNYKARRSPNASPITLTPSQYTEEMVLSPVDGNWHMFEMELAER